jgi:hypothetical protein
VQVLPAEQLSYGRSSNLNLERAGAIIANATPIGAGAGEGVDFSVYARGRSGSGLRRLVHALIEAQ